MSGDEPTSLAAHRLRSAYRKFRAAGLFGPAAELRRLSELAREAIDVTLPSHKITAYILTTGFLNAAELLEGIELPVTNASTWFHSVDQSILAGVDGLIDRDPVPEAVTAGLIDRFLFVNQQISNRD